MNARETENYTMKNLLEKCCDEKHVPEITYSQLLENSNYRKFPVRFPVSTIRTHNLCRVHSKEILERNAQLSYPIVHEKVIPLMISFLEHKISHGSQIEKEIYKDMDVSNFITRLLTKRAVQFYTSRDYYQLLSGDIGSGGWETVGTVNERAPLLLRDCLSYDEIKISALVAASSPSFFINTGSRRNEGIVSPVKDFQQWGIVIGAVGCRFEKRNFMEWQDMMVTDEQNTKENGYGDSVNTTTCEENKTSSILSKKFDLLKIWAGFYNLDYFPVWDYTKQIYSASTTYHSVRGGVGFFNGNVYTERCKMLADVILLEANQRGQENGQKVFLHVVGLGLGVWRIAPNQTTLFLEAFHESIQNLKLPHITDIYFAWFGTINSCKGVSDGEKMGESGITIHFGKRDPHSKLIGVDENKLLVVTYAWDGNSLPGNEFWGGGLSESGDPAQACSSQIAELQNPHINPKINGNNVRIASPSLNKLFSLSEFAKILIHKAKRTEAEKTK